MKNIDDKLVEMSKGRSELNDKLHREEEVNGMIPLFGTTSSSEWSTMAYKTSLSDFLIEDDE